jgi:hypothetical protein
MQHKMNLSSMILALLSATLANIVLVPNLLAQSIRETPHNREKLGSSLKRLKWDSKKRVAVESNEQKNTQHRITQAGTDEAIKLETLLTTFNLLVTDYKGQPVQPFGFPRAIRNSIDI